MNRLSTYLSSLLILVLLSGCASFGGYQEPMVKVVGLDPLPSEGLELRFALKMRLQNPNETAIDFDGVSVSLDIDGRGLASGVSDQRGTVPRFGESVIDVPISISAFTALRQALGMMSETRTDSALPYSLQGRFGGSQFGGLRFSGAGTIDLPALGGQAQKQKNSR